jgi:gamma-glutamyltranspeptidase / glutathione hydrolase
MLGVTEPYVAGIGGGGLMVIYFAYSHKVVTIDGRETAPATFPQDAFIDPATGKPIPFNPQRITSGMASASQARLRPGRRRRNATDRCR